MSVSQSVSEWACLCLVSCSVTTCDISQRETHSVLSTSARLAPPGVTRLSTNTVTTTTSSHQHKLPTSHQGLLSSQLTKTKPLILPSCTFIVRILRVFVIVAREMRYKNPVRAWAALCSPASPLSPPSPPPLLPHNCVLLFLSLARRCWADEWISVKTSSLVTLRLLLLQIP